MKRMLLLAVLVGFLSAGCGGTLDQEFEGWKGSVKEPALESVIAPDLSLDGSWTIAVGGQNITRVEFQPINVAGKIGVNRIENLLDGKYRIGVVAKNCVKIPGSFTSLTADDAPFCKSSTPWFVNLTVDSQGPEMSVETATRNDMLLVEVGIVSVADVTVHLLDYRETAKALAPARFEIPWGKINTKSLKVEAVDEFGRRCETSVTITFPSERWEKLDKDSQLIGLASIDSQPCPLGWCGLNRWTKYESNQPVKTVSTNTAWWCLIAVVALVCFMPILGVIEALIGLNLELRRAMKKSIDRLRQIPASAPIKNLGWDTPAGSLVPADQVTFLLAQVIEQHPEIGQTIQNLLRRNGDRNETDVVPVASGHHPAAGGMRG